MFSCAMATHRIVLWKALAEYRIGALEYEFVDGEEREIAVHIPSDADMSVQSIQSSLAYF